MEKLKPLEHGFKSFFVRLMQRFLRRGNNDFSPIDGHSIKKVLFLRPEKIGDMVISLPVFDGLHRSYPHLEISILGSPKNFALIKDDPRFSKIFMYRKNILKDILQLFAMRRERVDCVVDMICDDSVTALFLSQLTAPGKPRIGVGKVKYREFYDFNYDHRMNNTGHIVENTLKLLEAFGIDSESVEPLASPHLTESARDTAKKFLASLGNITRQHLIGYNLSAGSKTRIWAPEKATELLQRILLSANNCSVILFAIGEADRERAERLRSNLGVRVHLVPDGLNLIEASALIGLLGVLITPDTSLVHIARAQHVPVVGLYSRFMKNFRLWRPYGQSVGAVVSGNDHNIFDITVDQVYEAFMELYEQGEPKAS